MEWLLVIAVAVVVAVLVALVLRYVVDQMALAAKKYRDAIIRDEIESTRAWLESKKQQPHG